MARRYLFVVNPAAGRNGAAFAERVVAAMMPHGVTPDVYHTRGVGDATAHLRALETAYDVVVACGGDGTVNEVLNGIAGRDIAVGLVPGGTTNVLAGELGYPSQAGDIARLLLAAREKEIWLATVNGRRFSMMTGIGYDAWVVAGVDHGVKRRFGKAAYVLSMLRELRQFGSRRYRVTIDGQVHDAMSMVITNGRRYAGSYTLSHRADITRPSLQAILVQTESAARFLGMLFLLPLGMVERLPFILSLPGRAIDVELVGEGAGSHDPVQADGDTVSAMPATIRVEDRPTRVLVP